MYKIAVFGSSSSAGKSTITMFLLNLLKEKSIPCAPFKAQNFSNNSSVADDNSEIAFAQYFQAKSIDIITSYLLNPILIKSAKEGNIHIIKSGRFFKEMSAKEYYCRIPTFKKSVEEAFLKLSKNNSVVCEGAGSPTELNFSEKDLANIFIAQNFNPKIIFVADIERGGVFASIYGTKHLLKKFGIHIDGVIINKFRGNIELFKDGVKIIEKEFKLPVLGVLPYTQLNIGFEDSLNIGTYSQNKKALINIGVFQFNYISNYYDIEPFILDQNVQVTFFNNFNQAKLFDLVVFLGTRQTVKDLLLLKSQNYRILREVNILAICGGYQMLFEDIYDNVESDTAHVKGLGLIKGSVYFNQEKTVRRGVYNIKGFDVKGFEMHYGKADKLHYEDEHIFGTFVHEALFNNGLRNYILNKINPIYEGFDFKKAYQRHLSNFIGKSKENFNVDKFFELL